MKKRNCLYCLWGTITNIVMNWNEFQVELTVSEVTRKYSIDFSGRKTKALQRSPKVRLKSQGIKIIRNFGEIKWIEALIWQILLKGLDKQISFRFDLVCASKTWKESHAKPQVEYTKALASLVQSVLKRFVTHHWLNRNRHSSITKLVGDEHLMCQCFWLWWNMAVFVISNIVSKCLRLRNYSFYSIDENNPPAQYL